MKRVYYEAYTDAGTVRGEIRVDENITFDDLQRRIESSVVNDICIIKEEPDHKAWGR